MKSLPPALLGKKASDTFMEYVEPFLKHIMSDGSVCTTQQIEIALRIPWCVWNAYVMDNTKGKRENKFMNLLMSHLPGHRDNLVEDLIKRKKTLFNQYNYLFGEYSFFIDEKSNELRFRVESKLPPKT
jgi:hypothetical protein